MNDQVRDTRIEQFFICAVLGVVTVVVYLPALHHAFLAYDDQEYVTQNWQVLRGLTWRGLAWAFGFHAANWHPLTWLSHMLDCQIFGLRAWGHHLTNVLLHAANAVLLFLGLRGLVSSRWSEVSSASSPAHRPIVPWSRGQEIWQCAFVAALFAWHPLHVESVAWVAERKDGLSGFFFTLTLLAYAKYVLCLKSQVSSLTSRGEGESVQYSVFSIQNKAFWYGLALVLFALGLLSKPTVVTLPFVLLLLDVWPLRRLTLRDFHADPAPFQHAHAPFLRLLPEKLPFFALSGAGCALTIMAQQKGHAVVSSAGLPVGERIGHAVVSYVHYLAACFWPRHLAVFYPYQHAGTTEVGLCALLLVAVTIAAVWFARRLPCLLVGWFWFLGMLVPVIGLVQVGEQGWADRYTYLPSIGLFIVVIWGVSGITARKKVQTPNSKLQESSNPQAPTARPLRMGPLLGSVAAVASLAGTSVQLSYWKNTRTLFEHAEKVTRNNYMAIALVGGLEASELNLDEAIARYRRALQIRPGYAEAHYLLGDALDKQGKTEEAIKEYRQALGFKPMQAQTHVSLGGALAKQRDYSGAAEHYRAALRLNPESALAHNNLARLLHSQGRLDEAIEHYHAALKYEPNLAEAHNNLGALLVQHGNLPEGIAELRAALRLNGGSAETELNLALALTQQQRWDEAADLFGRTTGKLPWDANVHYRFGTSLEHQKKPRDAMREYASALLIQPDFPDALAALAWILSTAPDAELRNGTEAVRMAERACELTSRKDPRKLQTLSAACAESGLFDKALVVLDSARAQAASEHKIDLVQDCDRMSEAFRSGRAWRAPP